MQADLLMKQNSHGRYVEELRLIEHGGLKWNVDVGTLWLSVLLPEHTSAAKDVRQKLN